jgi:hypothetical protein
MSTLVWDTVECPSCGATVAIGLMSMAVECACGMIYVMRIGTDGWYYSWPHYASGEAPVGGKE